MRRIAIAACLITLLPALAHAKSIILRGDQPVCENGLSKSANISLNGNGRESTLEGALAAIEKQKKSIDTEITKIGVPAKLNNYSYSLSMNTNMDYNTQVINFTYNTNMSYTLSSEDAAKKLAAKLAEMKLQFSLSLSANRCNSPTEG